MWRQGGISGCKHWNLESLSDIRAHLNLKKMKEYKIVQGAVEMVEMALLELNKRQIVELDDERKAAMVSNLLIILCGDKEASPVVNTGTLSH